MPLQRTDAIVLRSIRQGETSKILTLYSRAFGKVALIAKGARSSRSKFGGSIEPLNYISILFYEKANRDLHILSEAEIIEPFLKTKQDLTKMTLAMAVCELINRLEVGAQPNPILFRLQLEVLNAIELTAWDPMNLFRAFEVRLMDIIGFRPEFSACSGCQSKTTMAVFFDIGSGCYVCSRCGRHGIGGLFLNEESLSALRQYQSAELSTLGDLLPSKPHQGQVDDFLKAYLKYHVDGLGNLRTFKFLAKIG